MVVVCGVGVWVVCCYVMKGDKGFKCRRYKKSLKRACNGVLIPFEYRNAFYRGCSVCGKLSTLTEGKPIKFSSSL